LRYTPRAAAFLGFSLHAALQRLVLTSLFLLTLCPLPARCSGSHAPPTTLSSSAVARPWLACVVDHRTPSLRPSADRRCLPHPRLTPLPPGRGGADPLLQAEAAWLAGRG
jgi:hypothetical protein